VLHEEEPSRARRAKRLDPDTERDVQCRINDLLATIEKARPDVVAKAIKTGQPIAVVLTPEPVPATLAITDWRAYLRRGAAARRGKPVPYVLHVPDGSPTVTVEVVHPLPPPRPPRGKTGRPSHWFTLDRYVRLSATDKRLNDAVLARKLTASRKLTAGEDRPVLKGLVRTRRLEVARRLRRREATRPPARPAP
jgi:hypothetical protein